MKLKEKIEKEYKEIYDKTNLVNNLLTEYGQAHSIGIVLYMLDSEYTNSEMKEVLDIMINNLSDEAKLEVLSSKNNCRSK